MTPGWLPSREAVPTRLEHRLSDDHVAAALELRQQACFWLVPWLVRGGAGLYLRVHPEREAESWPVCRVSGGALFTVFPSPAAAAVYEGLREFSEGFDAPYWAYDKDAERALRHWWRTLDALALGEEVVAIFERHEDPTSRVEAIASALRVEHLKEPVTFKQNVVDPAWLMARKAARLPRAPSLDDLHQAVVEGRYVEAWEQLRLLTDEKQVAGYPPFDAIELARRIAVEAGWPQVQQALDLLGPPPPIEAPPELGLRFEHLRGSTELDKVAEEMLLHGPPEARLRALDWLSEHPESRAHGAVLRALQLEPEALSYTDADGERANLRPRLLDLALETYTPNNIFMAVRLRAELRRPVYGALIVERLLKADGEWIRAQRDALLEANPELEGLL